MSNNDDFSRSTLKMSLKVLSPSAHPGLQGSVEAAGGVLLKHLVTSEPNHSP